MITRDFDLWITQGHTKRLVFNANQYDQGETWRFRILGADGNPIVPTTAAIIGQKKDGHAILVQGTVSDGKVVITETEQMTACAGLTEFELLLNGETHGTANFTVQVEKRPGDDADLSDSDLSLIQDAVDAAETIIEVIGDGDPSEVIGEHVDAWLDNHPEATTTVEDGAITAPKINQSLWDKLLVSEEASGAVASFDDGADDVPVSSLKVALEPIQLGSGDPSPTNIRPISGHSSVTVEQTGRNLYPIAIGRDVWGNNASGTHSTDNDVLTVTVTTASSSGVYSTGSSQFATLTPKLTGTYSYSLSAKASANGSYLLGFYGAGRETKAVTTQWQRFTFTGTFDGTVKTFNVYGTGTAGTIKIKDFMLELGSEAHEYVPYASASYPYTLGQSVYGGTVDLATGVLTVTWTSRTINGSESWTRESASATHHKYYILDIDIAKPSPGNYKVKGYMICDKAETAINSYDYTTSSIAVTGWSATSSPLNYLYLIVNNANMGFDNVNGLKAWLASNPLQVAYKLATPQTIQLTPTEVKTLLGYNSISSTGTVDVIYHADTKLYVDKMTNVDNAIIAPTEADFVATRNYTVNDLVIVNDTLYKCTANIASGSTITPNSNVQQTTLSALIKALS